MWTLYRRRKRDANFNGRLICDSRSVQTRLKRSDDHFFLRSIESTIPKNVNGMGRERCSQRSGTCHFRFLDATLPKISMGHRSRRRNHEGNLSASIRLQRAGRALGIFQKEQELPNTSPFGGAATAHSWMSIRVLLWIRKKQRCSM